MRVFWMFCATAIFGVLLISGSSLGQGNPRNCFGEGCCCNAQSGGNWDDCTDPATSCRRQTGAPYLQICTSKSKSPAVIAPLSSAQPANCKLPAGALDDKDGEAADCAGAGCCCNLQDGGKWPDCSDTGFECRKQTGPPYLQLCVDKRTPANSPLQLAPGQPANCARVDGASGTQGKRARKKGAPPAPDDIIDTGGDGRLFDYQISGEDLRGCGNGGLRSGKWKEHFKKSHTDPKGIWGRGWDLMAVELPCPRLTGGKVVEFQQICDKYAQRVPTVMSIGPHGLPVCTEGNVTWPPDMMSSAGGLDYLRGRWCIRGTCLTGVCAIGYYGLKADTDTKTKYAKSITPIVKYRTGTLKAECFYMKREDWLKTARPDN